MPSKQDRYRARKEEQGFQRIEVIVPAEFAQHLKAYARALRDAQKLGLDPPLFGGMGIRSQNIRLSVEPNITAQAEKLEKSKQDHSGSSPSRATETSETVRPKKPKPDFSGGLLDNPPEPYI